MVMIRERMVFHEYEGITVCPFCGRETDLTFHHFVPRKVHRRTHFKKTFTREELNQGVDICRLCHNGIHDLYDEVTLAKQFASFTALVNDPALKKHFAWVAKQKVRGKRSL
jgi:hypothetical protein